MIFRRFLLTALLPAALCLGGETPPIPLGTLRAPGTTYAANLRMAAHKHTLQVAVTGSPASCSVQLEGTLDDPSSATVTWANLSGAQTCTSSVMFHVAERPVRAVRATVTALSGGSSPAVTITYQGIQ